MNLLTQFDRKVRWRVRSAVEHLKYVSTPHPALTAEHTQAIQDLNTEGVHVTSLDRLFGASASKAAYLDAASFIRTPVHRDNAALWRQGISSRDITPAALLANLPSVYLAGLDRGLLALVNGYLRKSVAYHGCVIRHSAVDGNMLGTRLWHQDAEDSNVFRMVVYLNDVAPGGGPFEYIPRSTGLNYRQLGDGALTNERVDAVMPRSRWKQVYGPAGTVVLCDTAKVFHHESVQETQARSVVMIGYSSRFPKSMSLAMSHFPSEDIRGALAAVVPADRVAHASGWRKPAVARRELRQEASAQRKTVLRPA